MSEMAPGETNSDNQGETGADHESAPAGTPDGTGGTSDDSTSSSGGVTLGGTAVDGAMNDDS